MVGVLLCFLAKESEEVFVHLTDEVGKRNGFQSSHLGIVVGNESGGVFVSFEKQAVERTREQGLLVVMNAETEIKTMLEKLLELLGITAITVPYPRLTGIEFASDGEDIVNSPYAMQKEGFAKRFTALYFLAKDLKLKVVRRVAKAVESAFANSDGKLRK